LPYRLAALFRLRPDAIPAAVALLRKNGSERRITDGLGSAATAPAIVALSTLAYDRSGPPALRADALLAFAGVQHPTAAAMRVPAAFIDDQDSRVASAARLVSGTQARMGRPEHPAEAAAIDDALANRFENAKGAEDAVDLLAALGNSANPKLLPLIRNALYDTRPVVRAQAARSLRLLAGDETDRLLSNAIMSDADSNVRSAAIFASSFRHPVGATLTKALSHAAKLDNADSVRSSAVSLLGHDAEPTPEVAQSLEWVADHDPKPAIRQIAREALERITGPGAR
jgi:hypothetical protein